MPCSNSPFEETANEVSFPRGFIQDRKHQQSWEKSSWKGGEKLFEEYEHAAGKQRPCSCHKERKAHVLRLPCLLQLQNVRLQKAHTLRL